MSEGRTRPVTDSHESARYWEAARNHRLVVRQCQDCQTGIFPPTAHCPNCGSWDTPWIEVSGRGKLHAWTTVVHQLNPGYPTPYTIVVVELDDMAKIKMVGSIQGAPELEKDQPMEAWFEDMGEGAVLPQWKPVPAA